MKKLPVLVFLAGLQQTALSQEAHLYWGDTHLHTSNSTDAYENGNASVDLESAYRFARGLPVIHPATGQRVQMTVIGRKSCGPGWKRPRQKPASACWRSPTIPTCPEG